MRIVHRVIASLPDSEAIAKKFLPRWSGILVMDGKVVRVYDALATKLDRTKFSDDELRWMHKMRWLCGVDYGTGDLPHYVLADTESRIDLILYFQTLKSFNYRLVALVCDGNPEIPYAAKFVFGDVVVVQRCTRHFLEDLRALLPSARDDAKARAMLEGIILLVKRVIEADTIEEAASAETRLIDAVRRSRNIRAQQMFTMYLAAKIELTAHLTHPELHLPHTSNDIESLFKQLMLRLKSLGRFFHHRYANDYLNAWALLRRFTPFTDCCTSRRGRNGKAPLQIAGCEINGIDPFTLRKQEP